MICSTFVIWSFLVFMLFFRVDLCQTFFFLIQIYAGRASISPVSWVKAQLIYHTWFPFLKTRLFLAVSSPSTFWPPFYILCMWCRLWMLVCNLVALLGVGSDWRMYVQILGRLSIACVQSRPHTALVKILPMLKTPPWVAASRQAPAEHRQNRD